MAKHNVNPNAGINQGHGPGGVGVTVKAQPLTSGTPAGGSSSTKQRMNPPGVHDLATRLTSAGDQTLGTLGQVIGNTASLGHEMAHQKASQAFYDFRTHFSSQVQISGDVYKEMAQKLHDGAISVTGADNTSANTMNKTHVGPNHAHVAPTTHKPHVAPTTHKPHTAPKHKAHTPATTTPATTPAATTPPAGSTGAGGDQGPATPPTPGGPPPAPTTPDTPPVNTQPVTTPGGVD